MDHFAAIQSIIRAGLAGDRGELRKQTRRLRDRLEKDGKGREVATLDRLLAAEEEPVDMTPTGVSVSRAQITGERLTAEVSPPFDRETGAKLCSNDLAPADKTPVLGRAVAATVEGLLQEWSKADAMRAVGVEPTRTLLIYGAPGTGKTLTANYIARQLGLPLVAARIDGLISSFLGTTARNIANLFDFANRYACVLLLDEFDALAKLRDDPHEIGEIKRVVNTLLQNLDLRRNHGITIAITNHDGLLDPAVWRRFETHLHLGQPEPEVRAALIARFLEPLRPAEPTLRIFSYCLAGRSGADLERTCYAVKRTLALSDSSLNEPPALFHALSTVLARTPQEHHVPARLLATDKEAFISLIANDDGLRMKQVEIGEATGYGQSTVSDIKKSKRHLMAIEDRHAQ
jgi:hypothetical protein